MRKRAELTVDKMTEMLRDFRDRRGWKKYHTVKNLLISLVVEVGELLEIFQWMTEKEIKEKLDEIRESVEDELADVLSYLLLLADELGVDLSEAFLRKLEKNERKYPVEKFSGVWRKSKDK